MSLVSLRQLLDHAAEHNYGVPAFNVNNLEQIQAIMQAAEKTDSPVILQGSAGARSYAGEPILAVAAISEDVAANAIELIRLDVEALPHNVDPVDSLRPGSPMARTDGNVWVTEGQPPRPAVKAVKWTESDFAAAAEGRLPQGPATEEWSYGDLDAQFKDAALKLKVVPQITAASTVIMQIELENATPDFTRSINNIPPIDTQRALTRVQVADGATTVIGGIVAAANIGAHVDRITTGEMIDRFLPPLRRLAEQARPLIV